MKIPFSIKYRPQIESGEYKVETRDGCAVRIICWDRVAKENTDADLNICVLVPEDNGEAVYYYHQSGKKWVPDERFDLFIVTPEEELTEFEDGLRQICEDAVREAAVSPYRTSEDFAKRHSAELLALAIDARAKELSNGLKQSKLDKDSLHYHLIEFMCNLYTCPNWKEIEETAELYVTRIKAAALKDLPRWRKCGKETLRTYGDEHFEYRDGVAYIVMKKHEILLSDLEKLPGFKED